MNKVLKNAFLTVLFAIMAISVMAFAFGDTATAVAEDVLLESRGDTFRLTDTEYGENDKFVYTAVANFENGNAAGLVFGAKEDERYFVFNVDRNENRVKLIYFSVENGETKAKELLTDYFIGNDKMTESERNFVYPKVRSVGKVQLKVVITPENGSVYAEFYADNIRRFGVDNVIDLNSFTVDGVTGNLYKGGSIGLFLFVCLGKKSYSLMTGSF